MRQAYNIAKTLILLAIMLVVGASYAHAQNTSAAPYLGSWHKYRVLMDDVANTPTWQLQINGGNEIALYDDMMEPGDGEIWVRYGTEGDPGTEYAYIEIKFIDDPRFDVDDVATIIYSEMDDAGGTCVARRSITATVQASDFDLTILNTGDACNIYSAIAGWENGHGDISLYDLSSTVEFQVQLNKPLTLRTTAWQFSGTVSITNGGPANTLNVPDIIIGGNTNTTLNGSNGATWIASVAGTSFTIDVNVATPGFEYENDEVTFTVNVAGDITSDFSIRLQLDDGYIVTGIDYGAVSDDVGNGVLRDFTRTIYGVPNTSIVTYAP